MEIFWTIFEPRFEREVREKDIVVHDAFINVDRRELSKPGLWFRAAVSEVFDWNSVDKCESEYSCACEDGWGV